MKIQHFFVRTLIFTIIFASVVFAQTPDRDAYINANKQKDPASRAEAFKKFITDFPTSNYVVNSYNFIFEAYVKLNNLDSAFIYAEKYTNYYPPASQANPKATVANTLAREGRALDKAQKYIDEAVAFGREKKLRNLPFYLNVQALVLSKLQLSDSAVVIQREALEYAPEDAEMLLALSIYLKDAGKKTEAFSQLAKSVFFGNTDEALDLINAWLISEFTDTKELNKYKDKLSKEIVYEELNGIEKDQQAEYYVKSALFFAWMNSSLELAYDYLNKADALIDEKSPLETSLALETARGLVLYSEGKYSDAIIALNKIEKLSSVWDADYWFIFGQAFEKLGDTKNARMAYVTGLTGFDNPKNRKALTALLKSNGEDESIIDKELETFRKALKEFHPGVRSEKDKLNKPVLAELFTGAECPPCVASDLAFDKLSEYYPRNELVILEYHVHIPGPDPMTNPQTYERYLYYGGDFGTPTTFFDGKEKLVGGGPDYTARNRFYVYDHLIRKYGQNDADVIFSGYAELNDSIVTVRTEVEEENEEIIGDTLNFHTALVEKSVDYTGANGVSKHIFVVRALANGSIGSPYVMGSGKVETRQFNINAIERELVKYLDDPTKDRSWRQGAKFNGWRARTDKLNKDNLAVVIWVQNNKTKSVHGIKYFDVEK